VYGLAHELCGPTGADEVTVEVFCTLWSTPGAFPPSPDLSVRASLLADTHRLAVSVLRAGRGRRHSSIPEPRSSSMQDAAGSEHLAPARALDGLSSGAGQAIGLAYFGGYSCGEIAVLLREPVEVVKRHIRDGLAELRASSST